MSSEVRQVVLLTARSLEQRWRSLLAWSVGVVLIAVLQLAVYPSVSRSAQSLDELLQSYPEGLREAFGLQDYGTGPGYLHAELFSLVVPLVLLAVAVATGAAATAAEEERGTADLLLALPLRRAVMLAGKASALLASVIIVAGVVAVTLLVGVGLVELDVATSHVLAATAGAALLSLPFGAAALALGALTGRRAVAIGIPLALAMSAFLVEALGPLADWLRPWQNVSPFHWAFAGRPLENGLDLGGAALLLGVTVAVGAAAVVVFGRRDVRTT